MTLYARIREDVTREAWGYKSRTDPLNPLRIKGLSGRQAPETCRYEGGKGSLVLGISVSKLIMAINTLAGAKYALHTAGGWVNRRGGEDKVQQLSFACNVVEVTSILGQRNYIRSLDNSKTAPQITYESDPCVIHSFTVVEPSGYTITTPKGLALIIVVGTTPLWIATDDLEFFPTLPVDVSLNVNALNVRNAPAGDWVRTLLRDVAPVTILEYRPRASNVWGRIGANEWIALCHSTISGWYPTTWHMATHPAPIG